MWWWGSVRRVTVGGRTVSAAVHPTITGGLAAAEDGVALFEEGEAAFAGVFGAESRLPGAGSRLAL